MDDDVLRNILVSRLMDMVDEESGLQMRHILEQHAVQEFKRLMDRCGIEFLIAKCQGIQVCGGFTIVHMYVTFQEQTAVQLYGASKLMTYNGRGRKPDIPSLETGVSVAVSRLVNMLSGREAPYIVGEHKAI